MNEQNFFKRIIVALDVSTKEEALSLVHSLRETEIFKIGLKLFFAEGPELLRTIHSLNKKIFLDLKLHDIPNTVSEAVKVGVRHGVYMMTIHSSGGKEMMAKAVETGIREAEIQTVEKPLLLAVTVLTSLNDDQLKEIGIQNDTRSQVLRLARLAKDAGMDGIVCSPQEIEIVRNEFGKDFLVVTPGIRPSWTTAQDQKRIMTPSQAFKKGADYLVIGRPITASPSPEEALQRIVQELVESQ